MSSRQRFCWAADIAKMPLITARRPADLAQLLADLHGCMCRTRTAILCTDEPVWAHGSADLARGPGRSPGAGPARHEEPGRSRGRAGRSRGLPAGIRDVRFRAGICGILAAEGLSLASVMIVAGDRDRSAASAGRALL